MPLVRWSWFDDDKEKSLSLLKKLSEEIMAGKAEDPAKRRDELLKSMGGSKHHEKKKRRLKKKAFWRTWDIIVQGRREGQGRRGAIWAQQEGNHPKRWGSEKPAASAEDGTKQGGGPKKRPAAQAAVCPEQGTNTSAAWRAELDADMPPFCEGM